TCSSLGPFARGSIIFPLWLRKLSSRQFRRFWQMAGTVTKTAKSTPSLNDSARIDDDLSGIELSILMPCLNEGETLASCIEKALHFLSDNRIRGEIVIADNGSTDGSRQIAESYGVRIIDVPTRGYGAALAAGISAARGRYVVMGDADDSYDFS